MIDHNKALTGSDLTEFVNLKLFPYLHSFKQKASGPNTIEYKIGEIFGEIKNRIQSGYNLREIIDHIDELRFRSQKEKHELSHLYEAKIKNMGNAGRNGGEYYTPRPLIRAMVQVVKPKLGDKIYDGACGSAGFLCEAFDYLRSTGSRTGLTTRDLGILQTRTFYGKERKEVQQNFPIRTGETAFLFLQHFIKSLKAGGRGGVVIKNTFLSNTDNASVSLRKLLLESCNLHTILDCPGGMFQGAGVKTVVLFFEKGAPTLRPGSGQAGKIWYYQLDPGRSLGKTNPLNDDDLKEFIKLQASRASATEGPETKKSWNVDARSLSDVEGFDLSVKNPNGGEVVTHRSPQEIMDEIAAMDAESAEVLGNIRALLK
ncbi:MAG: N-6 DNA methylase [Nitrospira sp.]|nr:N-6 DNA methylase [Nitrospira sp.]